MNKARFILLICTITAAAWSFPGLALAKKCPPSENFATVSAFDGHSAFDGSNAFGGGSAFDGH